MVGLKTKAMVAALLGGTFMSSAVQAAVIEVAAGQSIQAAINSASSGDTIRVARGDYAAFQVTKDNLKIVSAETGGAHIVAGSGRGIESYGQSNIEISGFRISAPQSDGVGIGGSAGRLVRNIKFTNNVVEVAGKDGLKFFQIDGLDMTGNTIRMAGALGKAGQGGNSNGDGGIDWVTVNNSRMVNNTVERTNGWACAMIKTGSNGNLISGNRFSGCEVNGIDMAAGSDGAAGEANNTGKVAFNNKIQNNTISSGTGCAVKFHETSSNNRTVGNTISGRQCADPNGTNNASANVTLSSTADDVEWIEDAIDNMTAAGYTKEQIREEFRRYGIQMAPDVIDAVLAGTLGVREGIGRGLIDLAQGNPDAMINWLVSSGLLDEVLKGVTGSLDYTGILSQFVAGGGSADCDTIISTLASGAAGALGFLTSGSGRATLMAQIAQDIKLWAMSYCDAQRAKIQSNQLAEMRRMTAPINGVVVGAAGSVAGKVMGTLGLSTSTDLGKFYQDGASADLSPEASAAYQQDLRSRTDRARRNALATAARAAQAEKECSAMTDKALALTMKAPGQTAAVQAQTQFSRATECSASVRHSTQVAFENARLMAEEEERAGERLAQQRRDRLYRRLSSENVAPAEPFKLFQ